MKRTAISLMLALAIVFSLMLAVAPQALAAEHQNHCVCGGKWAGKAEYHTCADVTDWQPLSNADLLLNTAMTSGNYYLTEDIVLVAPISIVDGNNVTICLNGFDLSGNPDDTGEGGRVFSQVLGNGSLTITDCAAVEGTLRSALTKTTAGVGYVTKDCSGFVFNMYAGTVDAIRVAAAGGAFRFSGGVFNMYGGTIQNGSSKTYGGNLAIYSTFNMYGGVIKNGQADQRCGNLYLGGGGTANLYGGMIYGASDPQNADVWVYCKDDNSSYGALNVYNVDSSIEVYYENEDYLNLSQMDSSLTAPNKALKTTFTIVKEGYSAPTEEPTQEPTEEPTQEPTEEPTQEPTEKPTQPAQNDNKPAEEQPMNPILWVVIGVAVVAVVVVVVVVLKKKKA